MHVAVVDLVPDRADHALPLHHRIALLALRHRTLANEQRRAIVGPYVLRDRASDQARPVGTDRRRLTTADHRVAAEQVVPVRPERGLHRLQLRRLQRLVDREPLLSPASALLVELGAPPALPPRSADMPIDFARPARPPASWPPLQRCRRLLPSLFIGCRGDHRCSGRSRSLPSRCPARDEHAALQAALGRRERPRLVAHGHRLSRRLRCRAGRRREAGIRGSCGCSLRRCRACSLPRA